MLFFEVESVNKCNCCQYFAKCKLECQSENVDCVTKLTKFIKMMDTDTDSGISFSGCAGVYSELLLYLSIKKETTKINHR